MACSSDSRCSNYAKLTVNGYDYRGKVSVLYTLLSPCKQKLSLPELWQYFNEISPELLVEGKELDFNLKVDKVYPPYGSISSVTFTKYVKPSPPKIIIMEDGSKQEYIADFYDEKEEKRGKPPTQVSLFKNNQGGLGINYYHVFGNYFIKGCIIKGNNDHVLVVCGQESCVHRKVKENDYGPRGY